MIQPIEGLRDNIVAGAAALGGNPTAIGNHFTNIIEGIRSILGSYEQVILGSSQIVWHEFLLSCRSLVFVLRSEHKSHSVL